MNDLEFPCDEETIAKIIANTKNPIQVLFPDGSVAGEMRNLRCDGKGGIFGDMMIDGLDFGETKIFQANLASNPPSPKPA